MQTPQPCSTLPAFFLAHAAALGDALAAEIGLGQSVALPTEYNGHKLSLALLRELAAKHTVGTFVVVDHGTCFELCNLGKGADSKLFYAHCKMVVKDNGEETAEEKSAIEQGCEIIRKSINSFVNADIEAAQKYDPNVSEKMREYNYITYSYLQRKSISQINTIGRRNKTKLDFRDVLQAMEESGELLKVSQAVTEKLFDVSGKVYDYSALIAK